MIALVVALGGTAVAASHLVKGDNLIKKRSLSGNRLKNHTITGKQVNMSKLGKVPSAATADKATTATSATSATTATSAGSALVASAATNATNATNATTASNLVGVARFNTSIAPAGTALATAATTTLATAGPLTVTGDCWNIGTATHGAVYVSSTAAGYYGTNGASNLTLPANAPELVSIAPANAVPPAHDFESPFSPFAAITGNLSNYVQGEVSVGANLTTANKCTFAGFISTS